MADQSSTPEDPLDSEQLHYTLSTRAPVGYTQRLFAVSTTREFLRDTDPASALRVLMSNLDRQIVEARAAHERRVSGG